MCGAPGSRGTAYIQSVQDTASAASQLARDFDTVNDLAGRLETQREWMTQEEVVAGIDEGRDRCNRILDSTYSGHSLSVRLIGRVYGLRALFHLHAQDYILADIDSAYALSLNPHQRQVLAYWLQFLNSVEADKSMSCVVSIAKEAIWHAHRSGEECALDEAGRQEQVDYYERQLQTLLAARGAAGFNSLICKENWRRFCGQDRKKGRQYLLEMSPDKVPTKAGDFGNHMGLKLAYLPQLITSNMADHFEAMRENQQEYHASFSASLQGEQPHADLSVELGCAPQPPTGQTCEDEDTDTEDVSDANHCQDGAPTSPVSTCSARDSPGQHSGSECASQAKKARCSSTESFEDGSGGSGAFSPVYVATSPSFSPRGSPASPPAAAKQPPIFADKAGTARPSTARGPGNTQQRAGRSAFCFGRPARPQATPAADAEDAASRSTQPSSSSSQAAAEQTDQSVAAGCGTSADSAAQQATAHHSAAGAVLSEVAFRLQQAEAEEEQAVPTEGEAEAMQTEGMPSNYAQTEGMPSGSTQTHSSFCASSSPPHSFGTSTPTHSCGAFQTGGQQPIFESSGAPARRPARRCRQAGSARRIGKAAH